MIERVSTSACVSPTGISMRRTIFGVLILMLMAVGAGSEPYSVSGEGPKVKGI